MNHLYSKNEFLSIYKSNVLNEGFFQFLGNIFKKISAAVKNVNGAKEVDAIFKKYQTIIDNEFKNKLKIDLGLTAEEQLNATKEKENPQAKKEDKSAAVSGQTESIQYRVNEAEVEEPVLSVKTLKQKQTLMQNLLKQYQDKALKEMDRVLQKMGGKEKNPKLSLYIDTKKDEFNLMFLNAEIAALEKGGDQASAAKLIAQRNKLAKEINTNLDNIIKNKAAEINIDGNLFKIGVPYRYKAKDGTIKVIKISNKSEKPGEVMAAYISPEMGKTEIQPFQVENIDKDFKPEVNKEYNFYNSKGETIKVKVDKEPDNKGMVHVVGPKGGGGFNVNKNTLMDIVKNK